MKRLVSVFLCLVLVFSFSVTSFAAFDNELDALNSIDLNTGNTFTVLFNIFNTLNELELESSSFYSQGLTFFTSCLNNILDINEFTRLNNEVLTDTYELFNKLYSNVFGTTIWLQPFADTVTNALTYQSSYYDIVMGLRSNKWYTFEDSFYYYVFDLLNAIDTNTLALYDELDNYNKFFKREFDEVTGEGSAGYALYMLQQVLADEEDLAMKESQKANQEAAFDSFFFNDGSYNSSTSLNPASFSALSNGFTLIQEHFGIRGTTSDTIGFGFEYISEILSGNDPTESGSSPLAWFTAETSFDIDRSASTYSLRSNKPVIVTDYYSSQFENLKFFRSRGDS